ncbi:hypothetical protein PRZ48_010693 [Zasmidium cellare]|uniref:Uncharacterized protein n=1 Tax=Zasmidium cellare TaxID=395010 RepID=A0ABR0E9C1_ZASCE|nr:hypothetical protein PRZ48_010693 [Zasmidium cellare]
MIYRYSGGKVESYDDLYKNLQIGGDENPRWDSPPPPSPPRQQRYFGQARPSTDPDSHVYQYYNRHYEMAPKRGHNGRKVKQIKPPSESSADTAVGRDMSAINKGAESNTAPPPAQRPTSGGSSQAQATSTSNDPSETTAWPPSSPDHIDAVPANASPPMPFRQLLLHTLHQANIIVATMSSYFSQDAIIRDLINDNRPLAGLTNQHYSIACLLVSARADMIDCRAHLLGSQHIGLIEKDKEGSFRSFCLGMEKLDKMVDIVYDAAKKGVLATTENIAKLKVEWERCMWLRDGNEGHEPWTLCWEMVSGAR